MKTGKQMPIIINTGMDIVYFLNIFSFREFKFASQLHLN